MEGVWKVVTRSALNDQPPQLWVLVPRTIGCRVQPPQGAVEMAADRRLRIGYGRVWPNALIYNSSELSAMPV